jgi:hypothetical protein
MEAFARLTSGWWGVNAPSGRVAGQFSIAARMVQVKRYSLVSLHQKHSGELRGTLCCSILIWWNTPLPAPIAERKFRWCWICRFEAKPTSKIAKFAATRSRSVTACRMIPSRNSPPKPSNKFVVECNRLLETTHRTGGSQAKETRLEGLNFCCTGKKFQMENRVQQVAA